MKTCIYVLEYQRCEEKSLDDFMFQCTTFRAKFSAHFLQIHINIIIIFCLPKMLLMCSTS